MLVLTLPFAAMAAEEASGTIIMEYDLSRHPAEESARLWIPYPLSDQNQSISNILISGDYAEAGVYSHRKYSTGEYCQKKRISAAFFRFWPFLR